MKTFIAFTTSGLPSIIFVAAVAAPLFVSIKRQDAHSRFYIGVAYIAACFALLLTNRMSTFLYDPVINPDEALMAANALKAHYGWLNWTIIDPLTSGPLNSSILAWPRLFGADITFFGARLTGALLLFSAATMIFLVAIRISDLTAAIIASFPLLFFTATTSHYDFVHYTSELLPVFLIVIGICGYLLTDKHRSLPILSIAALALGCVPYAKLQASPIAALVGLFLLSRCLPLKNQSRFKFFVILGAAVVPTAIFLGPLAVGGEFDDFYESYFAVQASRVVAWHDYLPLMIWNTPSFFSLLLAVVSMTIIAVLFQASKGWKSYRPTSEDKRLFLLTATTIPIAYFCVVATGRRFSHYLLILIPLVALAQLCLAAIAAKRPRSSVAPYFFLYILLALLMLPTAIKEQRENVFVRADGAFLHGLAFEAPRRLQWLKPKENDKILCWGWQAECYVDNVLQGATREATNENQIRETPLKQYFRQRFMTDLSKSRPTFILDAVAPGSFGFKDVAHQSVQSFPELRSFVERDYERITTSGDDCPRLYVERQRLTEIRKNLVDYVIVSISEPGTEANVSKINDSSVLEICNDFWAPASQAAWFSVRLNARSVRTIALLNTRGGQDGNRSTRRARISLQTGQSKLFEQIIKLKPFPQWTIVSLPENIMADTFSFEILSHNGIGGGLNELKFYSD